LRVARAAKVIGMPLTQAQCLDALQRLGLPVAQGEGTLTVTPPSYRFDLQIEEDLIEEVVRMVGYNQLPETPPLAPITASLRLEAERSPFAVRRALASLGYQETINFSFVEERWEHELAGNPNPIKLLNPIASQMSVMRSSLLGSLLQVLKFNLDRKAPRVNVFELGRVFLRDAQVQNTDTTVAGFQPAHARGRPGLWPASGAELEPARQGRGFLRRQGRRGGFACTAPGRFCAGNAPRHAPRPLRQRVCGRQADWLCGRAAPAVAPGL
jgi:phenylalanyl-tRNA synthetase beta chain